jgi:hypothetical protein
MYKIANILSTIFYIASGLPRESAEGGSQPPGGRLRRRDAIEQYLCVKDGKVVCFFQSAHKFKTRYATLGFSDEANLDEGACGRPPSP